MSGSKNWFCIDRAPLDFCLIDKMAMKLSPAIQVIGTPTTVGENMRTLVILLFAAAAFSGSFSTAQAEEAGNVTIPDKVRANILKRHPQAQDLKASHETHFGQQLLEVSFKDTEDELKHELFRTDGALFANEILLANGLEISPDVTKVLADNFAGYRLEKAELVINPNGVGEEYELFIEVAGNKLKVSVNDKGSITAKDKY
jgi:hypothetical protein